MENKSYSILTKKLGKLAYPIKSFVVNIEGDGLNIRQSTKNFKLHWNSIRNVFVSLERENHEDKIFLDIVSTESDRIIRIFYDTVPYAEILPTLLSTSKENFKDFVSMVVASAGIEEVERFTQEFLESGILKERFTGKDDYNYLLYIEKFLEDTEKNGDNSNDSESDNDSDAETDSGYKVIIEQIPDDSKKQIAVVLSKLYKVDIDEVVDKIENLPLIVAKDLNKEKAEKLISGFEKLNAECKIEMD